MPADAPDGIPVPTPVPAAGLGRRAARPGTGPSLLAPGAAHDPYRLYRVLREEYPLSYDALLGAWLLSRYADVTTALTDPRFTGFPHDGAPRGGPAPRGLCHGSMLCQPRPQDIARAATTAPVTSPSASSGPPTSSPAASRGGNRRTSSRSSAAGCPSAPVRTRTGARCPATPPQPPAPGRPASAKPRSPPSSPMCWTTPTSWPPCASNPASPTVPGPNRCAATLPCSSCCAAPSPRSGSAAARSPPVHPSPV